MLYRCCFCKTSLDVKPSTRGQTIQYCPYEDPGLLSMFLLYMAPCIFQAFTAATPRVQILAGKLLQLCFVRQRPLRCRQRRWAPGHRRNEGRPLVRCQKRWIGDCRGRNQVSFLLKIIVAASIRHQGLSLRAESRSAGVN